MLHFTSINYFNLFFHFSYYNKIHFIDFGGFSRLSIFDPLIGFSRQTYERSISFFLSRFPSGRKKIYWLILIYTSTNTIWQLSLPVLLPTTTATIFSSPLYSSSSSFSSSSSSSSSALPSTSFQNISFL